MKTLTAAAPTATELQISAKTLYKLLKRLSSVMSGNPLLPVLECVFVKMANGSATFTGYDLQSELSLTIDHDGEGSLLMPHARLLKLTKALGDLPLKILALQTPDGHSLAITCEDRVYRIGSENPMDFPKVPGTTVSFGPGAPYRLPARDLKDALAFLSPSIAIDELRPSMCGISFKTKDDGVEMATTDGHILSRFRLPVVSEKEGDFIITGRAASVIPHVEGSELELRWTRGHISVTGENSLYIGRLVDETYPEYQKVIPEKGPDSVSFVTGDLKQALSRVRLFASTSTSLTVFKFNSNVVTISAKDLDCGNYAKEQIPTLASYKGKPLKIGFRASLISKAMKQHPKTVEIHTFAANKAVLFFSEDVRKLTAVMPMALGEH